MKMRLLSTHYYHLISGDSSLAIIWALHFGYRELIPSNWTGGYNFREDPSELYILHALVREGSLVVDK